LLLQKRISGCFENGLFLVVDRNRYSVAQAIQEIDHRRRHDPALVVIGGGMAQRKYGPSLFHLWSTAKEPEFSKSP